MKRFFTCLTAVTAGMMMMHGTASNAQNVEAQIKEMAKVPVSGIVAQPKMAAEGNTIKLPQKETRYALDGESWIMKRIQKMEYDDNNLVKDRYYDYYSNGTLSDRFHYILEYNDNLTLKKETQLWAYGDDTWYNFLYYLYEYDEMVPKFRTSRDVYLWNSASAEWYLDETGANGSYFNEIQRDVSNRITMVKRWDSKLKQLPSRGYSFEYDGDNAGAKNCTTYFNNGSGELVPNYFYDNIVWEKTNSQYVNVSNDVLYPFGNDSENFVKSFSVYQIDEELGESKFADVEYSYDDQMRVSDINISYADNNYITNKFVYDASLNGGSIRYIYTWEDKNGNSKYDDGEVTDIAKAEKHTHAIDTHGNDVLKQIAYYNASAGDFTNINREEKWERLYLYDGAQEEYIYSVINNGTFLGKEKYVFEDFIERTPTGIKNAENDTALKVRNGNILAADGLKYVVSDVQGRIYRSGIVSGSEINLNGMPSGMYIVRVGGNVVKIVR